MRSIGKVKIKKLKAIVKQEYNKEFAPGVYSRDIHKVQGAVNNRIPGAWYDTWESAWSEIDRLSHDFIDELYYNKEG